MKTILWIFTCFVFSFFESEKRETVIVRAGEQVQIEDKTIILQKTSIKELLDMLRIDDVFDFYYSLEHGIFGEAGEETCRTRYVKNILYKGIDFEYTGKTEDSLCLEWIRIKHSKFFVVKVNEHIKLGDINPPVDKYFKKQNSSDYISNDSLTYNLYSQGISFQFDRKGKDRILNEVSIHYTIGKKQKER